MDKTSALSKSAPPSTPPATFMQQCEAREWTSRYKAKTKELGRIKAQTWWIGVKDDILRIRGQAGLDTLINEMNRQREAPNDLRGN
jgi:hypothetical protein